MIEIVRISGLATVQDAGRPGHMHEGVPSGGAMSAQHLARANAAAGNGPGEAAIEAFGDVSFVAHAPVVLGTCDGARHVLEPGGRIDVRRPKAQRVHYIALRGGVDVPVVLGGRGTLLVAKMGGFAGRPLARGDRLTPGRATEVPTVSKPVSPTNEPLEVLPGPDASAFDVAALQLLTEATFTVSPASDRTGTRLVGPPLPVHADARRAAAPMVRGAVEITPDGQAIVMGPDHPVTGGYPVLAVVAAHDFDRLMQIPLGDSIRFALRSGRF